MLTTKFSFRLNSWWSQFLLFISSNSIVCFVFTVVFFYIRQLFGYTLYSIRFNWVCMTLDAFTLNDSYQWKTCIHRINTALCQPYVATISISQNNSFRKLEYVCALYHCGTGNDNCMSAIEKKWQNHIVNDVGFTSDARHNSSLFFVQARRNRCERPKYFFFTFSSGIVITECEMRYVSICVVCRQPDL